MKILKKNNIKQIDEALAEAQALIDTVMPLLYRVVEDKEIVAFLKRRHKEVTKNTIDLLAMLHGEKAAARTCKVMEIMAQIRKGMLADVDFDEE